MPKKDEAEAKTPVDVDKSLDKAMAALQEKYGDDFVGNGVVDWIPLDSPSWTYVLGGGLPRGRVVEVSGEFSSGKSTSCVYFAAQAQAQGLRVFWIDAEQAYNQKFSQGFGLDLKPITPMSGEEALDAVEKLAIAGADLIVLDSISALTPQKELDGEITDETMALQARMLGKFFRRITPVLAQTKCCLVMINQIRSTMAMYGPKTETTGGKGVKFFSSIRAETKRKEFFKEKEGMPPKGILVRIRTIKNKCAVPFREADLELYYANGFDIGSELLSVGEALGLVEKKGSAYSIGEKSLGIGAAKAKEALMADEEAKKLIFEAAKA